MRRTTTVSLASILPFVTVVTVLVTLANSPATAQPLPTHYRHSANLPPGMVGRAQLKRGGPLRGYFQPVQITGPEGSSISLVRAGQFDPSKASPVTAGMLIGEVYRFRVTGIPDRAGLEVYPTIEVIDRMYPPAGQKTRFPIPVHVTAEELQLALDGLYVTRVIYIENPAVAFPRHEEPGFQRYFEVRPGEDPLERADQLGRPVAILRMGSRVPGLERVDQQFVYGSPQLEIYETPWRKPVVGELRSVEPLPAASEN